MQWLEITINTKSERLDALCGRLELLGVTGLVIEDENEYRRFLEQNRQYWDYIDEELEKSIAGVCRVRFYLEESASGRAELARLTAALPEEALRVRVVRDEDWENNWKQYYRPVSVGERLLIVPQWEEPPEAEGRCILRLDPGLIFGTGTHATTQMCLRALESSVKGGEHVLDLGCGSGILGIAALLFGAADCVGCDIDAKAPKVVMENAALNEIGPDRMTVYAGDVLSDGALKKKLSVRKYDVVTANIVADVIIALSPGVRGLLKETGDFLCSGIIEGRQEEVKTALIASGFRIADEFQQDGWYAYRCRQPQTV